MNNQYLPPVIAIPSALEITAISQSNPMVVTISPNSDQTNTYLPGQLVLLNIPNTYKMIQANNLTAKIIALSGSNISLNIDSTGFDPFIIPSGNVTQPASLAPSGSRNLQFDNTTQNLPFQSLNNIGN